MIYLTSDLHFNHNREFIYKPRGFNSVEEMNTAIVERWNSIITDEDTVYVLGDLCLGGGTEEIKEKNKKLIESLNGTLVVIRGNHDTDARVNMYYECKNIFFDVIAATYLKHNGYHFYLSHFPTLTANLEKESLKQTTINLFGHTHQMTNFYNDIPFMYHVGVDSHNCYPVKLDDIIEEMKNKIKECKEVL